MHLDIMLPGMNGMTFEEMRESGLGKESSGHTPNQSFR